MFTDPYVLIDVLTVSVELLALGIVVVSLIKLGKELF